MRETSPPPLDADEDEMDAASRSGVSSSTNNSPPTVPSAASEHFRTITGGNESLTNGSLKKEIINK